MQFNYDSTTGTVYTFHAGGRAYLQKIASSKSVWATYNRDKAGKFTPEILNFILIK